MEKNRKNPKDDRDFNIHYKNQLTDMKTLLQSMNANSNDFISDYLDYNQKCEDLSKKIKEQIDSYLLFFESMNSKNLLFDAKVKEKREQIINKIKENYKNFYDNILWIFENKSIQNIKNNCDKMNYILNLISDLDFDAPNINSLNNVSSTKENTDSYQSLDYNIGRHRNISNNYMNIYNDNDCEDFENNDEINNNIKDEKDEEEEDVGIICPTCNKNKVVCFCEKCNQLFCKGCNEIISSNEEEKKRHNMIFLDDLKKQNLDKLDLFLNSLNHIIKYILINCNLILTKKRIKIKNINDKNNSSIKKIKYIKRIYDYPYIKKMNDNNSIIEFLKDCQELIDNKIPEEKKEEDFSLSSLNKKIRNSIYSIFNDNKITHIKEQFRIIDENFYSDEEEDEYDEESYKIIPSEDVFIKNINKFYYVINLVAKEKNIYNNNIKTYITKIINEKLNINKNNIFVSFNKINNFLDTFIKTKNISNSSIKEIKDSYPNLNKLHEYKIIYDNIVFKKDYFDSDGNIVDYNSMNKNYDPPYGWLGIGLNVINKYTDENWLKGNDPRWAKAYLGVGQYLSSKQIKKVLQNIIINNDLIPEKSQSICNLKGKGKGIYLTPSINLAEKYSGIISINRKNYKIVLMAKVLIENKKEDNNFNFWILDKKDIRIYRILIKEIKY